MTTFIKDVDSLGSIILPEKWIKGVKRVKIVEFEPIKLRNKSQLKEF
jgi:hypothetical protein